MKGLQKLKKVKSIVSSTYTDQGFYHSSSQNEMKSFFFFLFKFSFIFFYHSKQRLNILLLPI